jgi:hypothetical protein
MQGKTKKSKSPNSRLLKHKRNQKKKYEHKEKALFGKELPL